MEQFSLDVSDSARPFAMLDLTAADAMINTWNDKYHWNFWRPIFAIRQIGADDGNPATVADPTWTPLFSAGFPTSPPLGANPVPIGGIGGPLGTPPYPDHPSGATTYASASMHALASFFGTDEMTFFATSSRFPGDQRTFDRFSDQTNRSSKPASGRGSTSGTLTCRRQTSAATSSATSTSTSSQPHTEEKVAGRPPRGRSTRSTSSRTRTCRNMG